MVNHSSFDDTCGVSVSGDWDQGNGIIVIEGFKEKLSVGFCILTIHFKNPGTSADFWIETVGDKLNFHLNFVDEVFRKKGGDEGFDGGGGVMFWVKFKEPTNLTNIDRADGVLIKKKVVFLKKLQDKRGVFDCVEVNGGLEGSVNSAEVASEVRSGEVIMKVCGVFWE